MSEVPQYSSNPEPSTPKHNTKPGAGVDKHGDHAQVETRHVPERGNLNGYEEFHLKVRTGFWS